MRSEVSSRFRRHRRWTAGAVALMTGSLGALVAGPAQAAATFASALDVAIGTAPPGSFRDALPSTDVVVADFNGDGKADFAVTTWDTNYISVRLGDGAGGFSAAPDEFGGIKPTPLAAGDFNNDGKTDLLSAMYFPSDVVVRLGVGDGTFIGMADVPLPVGSTATRDIAVADWNRDGNADFAAVNPGSDTVAILLGTGTGNFVRVPLSVSYVNVGTDPSSMVVADFNGDTIPDFATTDEASNSLSIRLGDGTGRFTSGADVPVGTAPYGVVAGDFNGDTRQDLAVTNRTGNIVSVRLGNGSGGFTSAPDVTVGSAPRGLATADFDGDAKLDLAVINSAENTVSIRTGLGTGAFASAPNVVVSAEASSVAVGDFNNDDHPDLVVPDADAQKANIRLNLDTSAASVPTCRVRAIVSGPPKQVLVSAFDLGSGIRSIQVTTLVNSTVRIEPYTAMGTFAPETWAVVSKTNQSLGSKVAFVVTDGSGRQASCY